MNLYEFTTTMYFMSVAFGFELIYLFGMVRGHNADEQLVEDYEPF